MDKNALNIGSAWAGGVRIAYQVTGEGPPLVCCHPMGWDHSLWNEHRERFSKTHRLITFDQRGSGDSGHPPYSKDGGDLYSVEAFGDDLRAVLDDLGIEKASILGFSMGAIAALQFATTWPERVERLILVSAMASRLPEEIIQRARVIEQTLAEKGLAETYEQYFSGALFEGVAANDSFKGKLAGVLEKATPHGFRGCYHVTIDRPSMLDCLNRIAAPTLIMVGERDKHYVLEADILLDKITGSRKVVVNNAGHAITVQQPQIFEDAILAFLQQPG